MTLTGWCDREPDLKAGGHHVIERRSAARRVRDLNLSIDLELFRQRKGLTPELRAAAGRRADDLQDQVLAIRNANPDLSLLECT